MRSVVRYDDITDEHVPEPASKKRRKSEASEMFGASTKNVQHWDDPGTSSQAMNYNDDCNAYEESRELTHEEIWDDRALIDAWNAASEEYEALHGPDKGWKKQPLHKSPLWYNTPTNRKAPETGSSAPDQNVEGKATNGAAMEDSQPLNFHTFVPEHDPSLSAPTYAALPQGMVSQDEAFTRAVEASYWSGYWTAVYHSHRSMAAGDVAEVEGDQQEVGEEEEEEGAIGGQDAEDLLPAQRIR
ncbi:hypothetical protein OE88DRAFT_1664885 [Heliocybe sulcata]|uniref:Survival Motor Neuron Gemin2-binding domain-containing protein n=1 Tax=Heliocybe sulcata TaxID=5364 RepID=A0A5C3MT08_9AGAM|nr:hypothetical protein OE88DRAFT_1664885 [Heliocybe sulcata]